jgi:hypothetical protein
MQEMQGRIAMATQDEIVIPTGSEHTTILARLSKEYAVLYERMQGEQEEADKALRHAEERQKAADTLKPQVEALRAKLRELVK